MFIAQENNFHRGQKNKVRYQQKGRETQREGRREREWEEKTALAERLSHMKSGMLWPYASPGGLGIQATVSKQRGHLRLNPEDFSNRGVRENNAAIICRQVRSPGLAEPNSPSGNSTGSSFRLSPASEKTLAQGVWREHWHVCLLLIFGNRGVPAHLKSWPGASYKWGEIGTDGKMHAH